MMVHLNFMRPLPRKQFVRAIYKKSGEKVDFHLLDNLQFLKRKYSQKIFLIVSVSGLEKSDFLVNYPILKYLGCDLLRTKTY